MDREIVLSSYSVEDEGNNTPQDFITKFNKSLILDSNHQYAVGLNRIVNMSFTWFNVNSSYGNQLIKYSSDNGSNFNDIILLACSRLSVSEDDRKIERAKNGISCERDPGVKRRGRESL